MTSLQDIINPILLNNDVVVKQQHLGVLRVTGVDAKKFLQGQITCDINKLTPDSGLYGAICSIKGRIITNFYLVQYNEDILMLMAKDLVEKTTLHLKKYAVFFKTELIDTQDKMTVYASFSAQNEAQPSNHPERFDTTQSKNGVTLTLCQKPLVMQWHIVESESANLTEQNAHLSALSILDARPLIYLEQSETILPQWLNMQSTGGISFTKGCYTGQEIVARMQYKGKSKKQLALVTWDGLLDTTKDITDAQGKSVGQIFAVAAIQSTHFAQIILNIEPNETETLSLDNHVVTLLPLPYSLETKK